MIGKNSDKVEGGNFRYSGQSEKVTEGELQRSSEEVTFELKAIGKVNPCQMSVKKE